MAKKQAVFAILTAAFLITGIPLASAQSTGLVIKVNPEAHLDISTIPLSFTVNEPGEVVMSQPVTVTAWVRALPGQQIELTAAVDGLDGPVSVPLTALTWSGAMGRATGGAVTANCTQGTFTEGASQSLISNWNQSGIATCTVSFSLKTDASWTAGTYSGHADLKLSAK